MDSRKRQQARWQLGSALLAVFWLMAILGLALFLTMKFVMSDADFLVQRKNRFQAIQLAEMGLSIGVNRVVKKTDPILKLSLDEEEREGYEVAILGEAGRININVILFGEERKLLKDLFLDWGLTDRSASALLDALKDWADSDELESLNGAENKYYKEQGQEKYPYNRVFYSLSEMTLVKGMDELIAQKPDWEEFFTLWTSGRLDVNEAPAELIKVFCEIPLEVAERAVEHVLGPDEEKNTKDDQNFASLEEFAFFVGMGETKLQRVQRRITVNDSTLRIESTGRVGEYKRKLVLILRNRDTNPIILSRKEYPVYDEQGE